jgi:hypothetical protein
MSTGSDKRIMPRHGKMRSIAVQLEFKQIIRRRWSSI